MKKILAGILIIILIATSVFLIIAKKTSANENVHYSFSTHGQTVYHLKTGSFKKKQKAVITAAVDGSVMTFTPSGKLLWKADTDGGFPFDLAVGDINKDGKDEVLVASGNGSLYAFSSNGKLLWKFSKVPPLYQVCIAEKSDGTALILTGGVEQVLYALSPKGDVVNTLRTKHCIRHIRTGNIMNDGNDYVAMATASSGLIGVLSLFLINPSDLSIQWEKTNLGRFASNTGKRFFSMLINDYNGDGHDEIILGGGWGENGIIYSYNHKAELLFEKSDKKIPVIPYRMNLLRDVTLADDKFIIGHFGNTMIIYETDGSLREVFDGPYSFADAHFDKELNILFMGSAISGGNGIYALRLNSPDWKEHYKTIKPVGKLVQIETNLETLRNQIESFQIPSYQPAPRPADVISRKPADIEFSNLSFTSSTTLTQKIENPEELWCRKTDRRFRYNLTADELVETVERMEASGQNFIIWSGHGEAMFYPLSTFERVIKAAPEKLVGFVFAEMEGTGQSMQEVVNEILKPLAALCKEYNKVIIFRNKNVFWNGSVYLPFWKDLLLNPEYLGVFVPGLEETNCRTAELSLSGRIGLWQTGNFDRWACRMVTDNANFDRMFEWGGQQVIIHHLRNLVSTASMGADIFFNDIHGGSSRDAMYEQLIPFYQMVEKGIINIPKRDEMLSLSGLAIGMKDPSVNFIRHGTNGHAYNFPEVESTEKVFDRLDAYWSGTTIPSHDFSSYAMNINRRITNYLPNYPYGLPAIIPAESRTGNYFKRIINTDGEFFYDEKGEKYTASEYKPIVQAALEEEASRLPVLVKGNVHWTVSRLDAQHVRITLIDPGYLDPADRKAEIILQHLDGLSCTDILSREQLALKDGKIAVDIPVGLFRILDVYHK
jgi:lambda-carrageenase